MPETRYKTEYSYPPDMPVEDKIPANATIVQTPYEVSDEELAEEAEQATCEEYLKHSSDVITQPEIWYLLRAFGKKLGYKVGEE